MRQANPNKILNTFFKFISLVLWQPKIFRKFLKLWAVPSYLVLDKKKKKCAEL